MEETYTSACQKPGCGTKHTVLASDGLSTRAEKNTNNGVKTLFMQYMMLWHLLRRWYDYQFNCGSAASTVNR